MQATSGTAGTQDSSAARGTITPASLRTGIPSPSHSLSAARGTPASGSIFARHSSLPATTRSARSAPEAGTPDGQAAVGAAVRALSPFVPRLLRSELAAEAPQLPSLARLAGLKQPDMTSVARVTHL